MGVPKRILKELTDIKFALDASAIVAVTDSKGNIIYANDKFCSISRYSREELIGKNHRILKSGAHPAVYYRRMWQTISSGKAWRGEFCNRAKDGSLYWVDSTIVPFLNEKGRPYQYISIRHEITQRKAMEEQIQALPKRIIQAQESECNRIARDIHDDLGQSLVTLKMMLQAGGKKETIAYLDTIIEKSRRLSARLRPSLLEMLGLVPAIKQMVDHINSQKIFQVRFVGAATNDMLFQAEQINIFRIVQEALANSMKHAKASKVNIRMVRGAHSLKITIQDNGRGFDAQKKYNGLGLQIMKERAQLMGGTVTLASKSRKGTCITLTLPVEYTRS